LRRGRLKARISAATNSPKVRPAATRRNQAAGGATPFSIA
jgi:hypothetical protein